ncbi:protein of unknown function [Hyphomicrobium sp. 1Nfss2.1]
MLGYLIGQRDKLGACIAYYFCGQRVGIDDSAKATFERNTLSAFTPPQQDSGHGGAPRQGGGSDQVKCLLLRSHVSPSVLP